MSKYTARIVGAMALAIGTVTLAISSTVSVGDEDDEQKATQQARKDILELVDAIEKPKRL